MAAPRSHAPSQARGPLGIMGVISLVLGVSFLVGRVLVAPQSLEIATELEQKRDLFLFWAGGYLALQGLVLVVLQIARSPHFATGAEAELGDLGQASLWRRIALLPRVLVAHRRAREGLNVSVQVLLAGALLVLANYVLARHELWRVDLTSSALYSLSQESRQLVAGLGQDLRVVVVLPTGQQGQIKEVETLLSEYRAANPRITRESLDPYAFRDPSERADALKRLGIPEEPNDRLLGLIVQAGQREGGVFKVTKSKKIPIYDLWKEESDPTNPRPRRDHVFMGEREVTSAFVEVLDEKRPVVYFLQGHGEPSIGAVEDTESLSYLVARMRDRSYQVKALSLLEREATDVPEDADALVIAGPKSPLNRREAQAVDAYLQRGGKLLLLDEARAEKDPETGSVDWIKLGIEEPLAERYGVRFDRWLVAVRAIDPEGRVKFSVWLDRALALGHRHPITQPLLQSPRPPAFLTAHALERVPALNAMAEELVMTNRDAGRLVQGFSNPLDPGDGAQKPGPYTLAIASERKDGGRASRVVVFGDVDWARNKQVQLRQYANLELFLNALNWCLQREHQLVGEVKRPTEYRLNVTNEERNRLSLIAFAGFPLLAAAMGFVAWAIKRRS
ncbi:MAG: GldG family protein [Planctomycetota bacterium]